eukprot:CAMPEP_0204569004 /NCGR_PEP_ID=MMETSP0661-20131031/37502_1 /ASSEMBLY_ACC=CAM_ASM_000606 /TAXON_ID=109239 /ORGANISM="Alexandrium margalefi, Strain AMGDE01CS-322" /LENGTH=315 /DNA_ID=CAMNT_0051577067 /DNA_START=34 /DNA_END=981 /DNA_ORIENTATION=-
MTECLGPCYAALFERALGIGTVVGGCLYGQGTQDHVRQHLAELLALPEELRVGLAQAEYQAFSLSYPAPAPCASPKTPQPLLCTVELDTLTAGAALAALGLRPVALNMANERNCGGIWTHMRGSQEECLFHSSSLPLSLWPHRRAADGRLPGLPLARGSPFYPLSEAGIIYSPRVLATHTLGRQRLPQEDRFELAVVSAAAQDLRWWTPGSTRFNASLLREKMRTVLSVAAAKGHDAVVLGAFGCGAFKNDPDAVAAACAELLSSEFAGQFRVVAFAVIFSQRNLRSFARHFAAIEAPNTAEREQALRAAVLARA